MAYGQAELYSLLSDSTITALVTEGEDGIFYDTVVPSYYADGSEVGVQDSTINYYRVGPIDRTIGYLDGVYSINCRADSMAEAEAMAAAVSAVVNENFTHDGYGFYVSVLAVIPPAGPTDVYNAPLEARVCGRTFN